MAKKAVPAVVRDPALASQSLRPADLFGVQGKVALVTGGSRGIGLMAARGLVEAGAARVYLCNRNAGQCAAAAAELNSLPACKGREVARALPGDLASADGCQAVVDAFVKGFGESRLDILVNNAGSSWGAPLEKYPAEAWDRVLRLNLVATFLLTQKLLPQLASAGTRDSPARVINVSSVAGIRAAMTDGPNAAFAYTASKAAVNHLTQSLCRALSPHNITVNAVAPGMFPSNMTRFIFADEEGAKDLFSELNPFGRAGRTADIAGAVVYLSSPAGAWVSGAIIPLDGGQHIHDSRLH